MFICIKINKSKICNNKIQLLLLMKKYERVNLTSDIYKEKSRSKSPFNSKFMESSQHDSQHKKYQNVCCPNCRYLFKIPKQNQRPKSPANVASSSSRYLGGRNPFKESSNTLQKSNPNKIHNNSVQVQTEQYLLGSLKSSPKRQIIKIDGSQQRYAATDRIPERQSLLSFNNDQFGKTYAFTDRHREQQRASALKDKSKQRMNVSPKIKTAKQLFPARSAYMNESGLYKKEKNSDLKYQRYNPTPPKKSNNQANRSINQYALNKLDPNTNNQLANELIKKVHLSEKINEIIQYQMGLPPEISVPSYCKMLMYEMQEQKQMEKKKQKEKSMFLQIQQIQHEQDDLPRFNAKNDREISRKLFNNQ